MHLPDVFIVKPLFVGRRAGRVRRDARPPGRRRRPGSGQQRVRLDRDLRRGTAHSQSSSTTTPGDPTRRCSASSPRTCACRTWSRATCRPSSRRASSPSASSPGWSSAMTWPRCGGYFDELLDYTERLTRAEIARWPDGVYTLRGLHRRRRCRLRQPIPIRVTHHRPRRRAGRWTTPGPRRR